MTPNRKERVLAVIALLTILRTEIDVLRQEEQQAYDDLLNGAPGQFPGTVAFSGAAYVVGKAEETLYAAWEKM